MEIRWSSVEMFGLCLSEEKEGFDLVGLKELNLCLAMNGMNQTTG